MKTQDRRHHSCSDYRDAAVTLWGEAGAYAYDTYDRLRARYFPDLPASLPIVIGITAYGHCLGLTRGHWDHGPRITLASGLFRAGRRRVDDTLLHEMLHASLILRGLNPAHDGRPWYAAIRDLSPVVLGHGVNARRGADRKSVRVPNPDYAPANGKPRTLVRKVPVPGAIPHGDIARWPYSFRPADYDLGERIPCPTY